MSSRSLLDDADKEFLVSVKHGEPEWDRLEIDHLSQLPSIRWKLINIRKMDPVKHKGALDRLIRSPCEVESREELAVAASKHQESRCEPGHLS